MARANRSAVERMNAADDIERGLAQLGAMLVAIHGGGAPRFNELSLDQQDNYLWACHDKVAEIQGAWQRHEAAGTGAAP